LLDEEIKFFGHENIQSLHPRTIEITKDKFLTPNGDCIIGINANKGCIDISPRIKDKIACEGSRIYIEIIVEPFSFEIIANGSSNLTLQHSHDIVIRKSMFICHRTLGLSCNFAASDIPRKIIDLLKDPLSRGIMRISVE
jgi:hypothetical protein